MAKFKAKWSLLRAKKGEKGEWKITIKGEGINILSIADPRR